MNLKSIIIGIALFLLVNGIVHVVWLNIGSVTLGMIPAHNWFSVTFLLLAAAFFIGQRLGGSPEK